MNRRHYQLFALAILVGAPLLVSLATNAVSPAPEAAPVGEPAPDALPDQASEAPPPLTPPPLTQPPQNQPGQTGVLASAAPTLDTNGVAIAVADPVGINIGGNTPAASPTFATPAMNVPSSDAPTPPPQEQAPPQQVAIR